MPVERLPHVWQGYACVMDYRTEIGTAPPFWVHGDIGRQVGLSACRIVIAYVVQYER